MAERDRVPLLPMESTGDALSMSARKPTWSAPLVLVALLLSIAPAAQAANGVEVRPAESSVPAAMNAGATAAVRIRVLNNGNTTWSPSALHRLGAWYDGGFNQVSWNGFACGGYMNTTTDARAFVCNPVPRVPRRTSCSTLPFRQPPRVPSVSPCAWFKMAWSGSEILTAGRSP